MCHYYTELIGRIRKFLRNISNTVTYKNIRVAKKDENVSN